MNRLWKYIPLIVVILGAGMFRVWADYALTQGSGTNFVAFDGTHGGGTGRCATTNQCAAVVNIDTTGTQTGTAANPFNVVYPSAQAVNASQAGTWNVTNITGTVVLPTGASTSALQTTGNTTLTTIANAVTAPVPLPSASGGWTPLRLSALSNTFATIKASAGTLGMMHCWNPNTAVAYVQVFNSAAPTVGTTSALQSYGVPPTNSTGFSLPVNGLQFGIAITVAATTSAGGGTAPTTPVDCNAAFN